MELTEVSVSWLLSASMVVSLSRILSSELWEGKGDRGGVEGVWAQVFAFYVLSRTQPLTSGKHEEVLKSPLAHGGSCLAGQPLIVVIQNDDLAMGIFLRSRWVKVQPHWANAPRLYRNPWGRRAVKVYLSEFKEHQMTPLQGVQDFFLSWKPHKLVSFSSMN